MPIDAGLSRLAFFQARPDEFGLIGQRRRAVLHGLGFAGALVQVGLPADEIPLALFTFNVGIELGQLSSSWSRFSRRRRRFARFPYAGRRRSSACPRMPIGGLAVFWAIDRIRALLF